MKTKKYSKEDIETISQEIKKGKMIAIPTDTVYGLAISSSDPQNYQKLVQAKGRPENKPFPLMVGTLSDIEAVAVVGPRERILIDAFMPGVVTFIFKAKPNVFEGLDHIRTIGIRMADDPWVQQLIQKSGAPIWLPSANLSGEATATNSNMVLEQLEGRIDGVIIGQSKGLMSSSVIDLTQDEIVVLRPGEITLEMILEEVEE